MTLIKIFKKPGMGIKITKGQQNIYYTVVLRFLNIHSYVDPIKIYNSSIVGDPYPLKVESSFLNVAIIRL